MNKFLVDVSVNVGYFRTHDFTNRTGRRNAYPCLQGNTSIWRFDKSKKEGEITRYFVWGKGPGCAQSTWGMFSFSHSCSFSLSFFAEQIAYHQGRRKAQVARGTPIEKKATQKSTVDFYYSLKHIAKLHLVIHLGMCCWKPLRILPSKNVNQSIFY